MKTHHGDEIAAACRKELPSATMHDKIIMAECQQLVAIGRKDCFELVESKLTHFYHIMLRE